MPMRLRSELISLFIRLLGRIEQRALEVRLSIYQARHMCPTFIIEFIALTHIRDEHRQRTQNLEVFFQINSSSVLLVF